MYPPDSARVPHVDLCGRMPHLWLRVMGLSKSHRRKALVPYRKDAEMNVVPELFPEPATFKTPSNSIFASAILQARIDFMCEARWTLRSLFRPSMGTTGVNLNRAAASIAEIENRYRTLVGCAIDEAVAKVKGTVS